MKKSMAFPVVFSNHFLNRFHHYASRMPRSNMDCAASIAPRSARLSSIAPQAPAVEIQPALHPGGIGLAQRRVRREFDARAQGEGACGHDDLAVITRHVPWLRRDKCVHGGALLHALAEGDQGLFPAQEDGLNDVRARLVGLGALHRSRTR